jgi:hypothetical protein
LKAGASQQAAQNRAANKDCLAHVVYHIGVGEGSVLRSGGTLLKHPVNGIALMMDLKKWA